jgi:hypothetical protein
MKTRERNLTGANRENGEGNLCSLVADMDLSRRSQTKTEVSQFSDEIIVNCTPLV